MSNLMIGTIVVGVLIAALVVFLFSVGSAQSAWFVLGFYVVGAIVLVVIERSGYKPVIDRSRGTWQLTGERFVDPATGKLMEVRFNPTSGQRDYVEVSQQSR